MPPRFLMLVLFVVGVSVCVSSGFALFVEYQNSCPPAENSTSEDNSEDMGIEQISPVQASAQSDEEDSSPCASTICHLAHNLATALPVHMINMFQSESQHWLCVCCMIS